MRVSILDCHKNKLFESEKIARALQRVLDVTVDISEVRKFQFPSLDYDAYVISGAEGFTQQHVWVRKLKEFARTLIDGGKPVLGVCFGNHLLVSMYGYELREAEEPEIGWYNVELTEAGLADPLFAGFPQSFPVFQYHKRFVEVAENAGEDEKILARNENGIQAIRYAENIYGVQFHAEETPGSGVQFLENDPKCTNLEAATRLKPEKYIEWKVFRNFVSG